MTRVHCYKKRQNMTNSTGIYAIRNLVTGTIYVGATRLGFEGRYKGHMSALKHGTHHSSLLQQDWLAHGASQFEFLILECLPPDGPMAIAEQKWIDTFLSQGVSCYNVGRAAEKPLVVKTPYIPIWTIYTVDEVADQLMVHRRTIINLLTSGKLVGFRVGRFWRITREHLECFIAQEKQGHASDETP